MGLFGALNEALRPGASKDTRIPGTVFSGPLPPQSHVDWYPVTYARSHHDLAVVTVWAARFPAP